MTDLYAPNAHRILLIRMQPYDVNATATTSVYIGSEPYISGPSDSPANESFLPVLERGSELSYTREAFSGDMLRGRSIPDRGALTIINTQQPGRTALFDSWLDADQYTWDGRQIDAWLLVKGDSFSSKTQVLSAIIDDIDYDKNRITFALRSRAYLLDAPIANNRYAGTGGAEGGADVKGKPKTRAFGQLFNAPAVLINSSSLIYQLNDGEIESVSAVRDNGVALSLDADYASYAALAAATLSAGEYATCLAEGLIRLNTAPSGAVTVDLEGSTLSGTYSAKAADILKFIGEEVSGVTADSAAISALNTSNSSAVGYYTADNDVNRSDVLDFIVNSIGAWWGFNRTGSLDCGIISAPAGSPSLYIDQYDIRLNSIARNRVGKPIWSTILDYKPNWLPQAEDALAGSVSAANRSLYAKPWSTTAATQTAAVQTKFNSAVEFTFQSGLYDSTAAETERNRLHTLYNTRRDQFDIDTNLKPLQVSMGQEINISHPRYNLSSGRNAVVFGFTERYLAGNVSIKVFA